MRNAEAFSKLLFSILSPFADILFSEFRDGRLTENLTMLQVRTILIVKFWGNRVGQIAEIQGVTQPAASRIVDDLVESGYLKRIPNKEDRRKIDLGLTKKSNVLISHLHERSVGRLAKAVSELQEGKQRIIFDGLQVLAEAISLIKAEEQ